MTTDRDDLGRWSFRVEAGKIAEFARAVGAPDHGVAPPTFTVVASADLIERLVRDVFRLDGSRTVHGEQTYAYFAPIRAGTDIVGTARLVSDEVRQGRTGGRMRVITIGVDYTDATTGQVLLRETSVILEKEA